MKIVDAFLILKRAAGRQKTKLITFEILENDEKERFVSAMVRLGGIRNARMLDFICFSAFD